MKAQADAIAATDNDALLIPRLVFNYSVIERVRDQQRSACVR